MGGCILHESATAYGCAHCDARAKWLHADGTHRAHEPRGATMSVREACRQRMPLDGTDAQALEHALTITERERDALVRELDALRAATVDEKGTDE